MKVLALAHQYVPVRNAGAETMLHGMLSALVRAGHEVHASLSMQAGAPYVHEGVRVWPLQGMKPNHLQHTGGVDLLVGHLDNTQATTFLGYLNDIPTVLVHHNTFEPSKEALHHHGARVDLVVVNSRWMLGDLKRWHEVNDLPLTPQTVIVRPTVNRAEYAVEPGDRVTLVNLRMRADTPTSRDGLTKGGEVFWACAQRMPGTKFLGVTGAYGYQAPGDLPNVEILDHVGAPDMPAKVYARTRVLLVPSSYESWGRVATEATAAGIPVICTPTPGLRENLGDAGIYIDPNNVAGYVSALQLLARPAHYALARERALARAAEHERMRIEDERNWVAAAESLAQVPV